MTALGAASEAVSSRAAIEVYDLRPIPAMNFES